MGITNSVDGRTHNIKCELAKDAGRIYRLDGKLKTGKDIKASCAACMQSNSAANVSTCTPEYALCDCLQAFLKERSINLDQSCCLIRQAQVTRLADSNSKS